MAAKATRQGLGRVGYDARHFLTFPLLANAVESVGH